MWPRWGASSGFARRVKHYEQVEKVRLLVVDDDPPIADLVATVARYGEERAKVDAALRRLDELTPVSPSPS